MNTLIIAYSRGINISFEFLVILVLFAYILYLHLQLSKKNFIIKTYIDKYGKSAGNNSKKDIILFLEKLKNPDYKGIATKDKMLDKKFSSFLFDDEKEIKLFLHYTAKKSIAEKIIKEGFKFVSSFYKTAEYIYNDELYLIHRHHEHKQYGQYVIVICISKHTYNHYSNELSKIKAKNTAVEQVLTEAPPIIDENSDEIYILPKQFIKGYFNYMDGTIEENPDFDFNYHSDTFIKNLENLKKKNH